MSRDGGTGVGRRTFLGVLGAATAAAGVGVGVGAVPGCGGNNGPAATPFDAGSVTDYTAPLWKVFVSNQVIVGRDSTGFFAYSAVCTHQNCDVSFCSPLSGGVTSADGTTCCGCHGSTFRGDGSVSRGPASSPLEHFQVTVAAGRVTVNPGNIVGAGTRTPAA